MPPGKGVNSYIEIEKQSFQTLDDAAKLIGKSFFIAKVDLRRAYRSVPVHPSNYQALGLKWRFQGDSEFFWLTLDYLLGGVARLEIFIALHKQCGA